MVDSNDRERVNEAREELMRMLAEDELRDAVLLIFANKQVWTIPIASLNSCFSLLPHVLFIANYHSVYPGFPYAYNLRSLSCAFLHSYPSDLTSRPV